MTLRITTVLALVTTLALLLVVVPAAKTWALEWWEVKPESKERAQNMTKAEPEAELVEFQKWLAHIECVTKYEKEPAKLVEMCMPSEIPVEQQLQNAREVTSLAAQQRRTVDDGYTYPKNATDEEKAAIDAKEYEAWEEAGRPGDDVPNPYCDQVSDEYMRNGGACHDRKDASDTTGLFTCNDGHTKLIGETVKMPLPPKANSS